MDYNVNKPYYGGFNLYLSIGKSIIDNTKMSINSYSNTGAIK